MSERVTWLELARVAADALEPDPLQTVSEWADQNRRLDSKSSAEPGRWRTARTPYLREIMDAMSPRDPTQQVVLMKGVQLGGTEIIINVVGYCIERAPGPLMLVQPTVELARRFSRQRIEPLVELTPGVRARISPSRSREAQNTIFAKDFPGGVLQLVGANSAVGLRSMPARVLLFDEVDGYPMDVDGEGDPIALAERRSSTFARRKILKISTPTTEGSSRIAAAYEESDQRQYHVPCVHCSRHQIITWERIKYELNDKHQPVPDSIGLACEHCGALIPETAKTWMLENGRWVPRHPERPIRGYHLSALYSPYGWFSWHDAVIEFLRTKKDVSKFKTFVNTIWGETWRQTGEAPEWELLYQRRESYRPGRVPPMRKTTVEDLRGPVVLTAGVDVQRDRLAIELVAWGPRMESWSVDYREIPGDPAGRELWNELDELLATPVAGVNGRSLPVAKLAIDSGDGVTVTPVYRWGRSQDQRRVMVTKGGPDTLRAVVSAPKMVDVDRRGKRIARGVRVWMVGAGHCKGELYAWLQQTPPLTEEEEPPVGWCHFPDHGMEFFRMLCAEKLAWREVRGYRKPEWTKTRDRNEALDCRVLARVAAYSLGVDRWSPKRWQREYEATLVAPEAATAGSKRPASQPAQPRASPSASETQRPVAARPLRRERRRGYLDS